MKIYKYFYTFSQFYTNKQAYLIKKFNQSQGLPEINGCRIIYKGDSSHYAYIREKSKSFKPGEQLYLYPKQYIDIGTQLYSKKIRQITYITKRNYQTVVVECKQKKHESLEEFLSDSQFYIKKGFLDLHPLESYIKLCQFMGISINYQQIQAYNKTSFCLQQLRQHTSILSYVENIRKQFLFTDQLKLQKLDRRRKVESQEEKDRILSKWKQTFNLDNVYSLSYQQQKTQIKWAMQKNMGTFRNIEDLIQGYGQRQYYALWENSQ